MSKPSPLLQPGQTWRGNTSADFPIQIMQPPDANGARAKFIPYNGPENLLDLELLAGDLPNTPNPRVQLQSPSLLVKGGRYVASQEIYLPAGALSSFIDGWALFVQMHGYPFAGAPPLSWSTRDGKTWGFYQGGAPWATLALEPILFDAWHRIVFDFVLSGNGAVTVSYDDKTVFTSPSFPVIDSADATGPWYYDTDIYAKRGTFTKLESYRRQIQVKRIS